MDRIILNLERLHYYTQKKFMNKKNTIYALIPARLNSKSIYHKNLKKINKRSLLEISIDEAKKVKKFYRIFVSSESEKIKKICEKKKVFFFKRNKKYSSNKARADNVIFEFIKKNKLKKNNIVVYLQPTSPFRNYKHINASLKKFEKNKKKTLISIKKINSIIFKSLILKSGHINPVLNQKLLSENRQSFPETYATNGAIYIFLVKNFLKKNTIPKKNSIPFLMNEKDSIDIDTYLDLNRARRMHKSN